MGVTVGIAQQASSERRPWGVLASVRRFEDSDLNATHKPCLGQVGSRDNA